MAEWVRADPYLLPGGGDGELAQPIDHLLVRERAAVQVDVGESSPPPDTAQARGRAVGAPQAGSGGRSSHDACRIPDLHGLATAHFGIDNGRPVLERASRQSASGC